METLTATSLDAVREYARGMEAMSGSKFEDALQSFSKAVALDPKFGVAYGAMAATSRNLERQQDAEKYAKEAHAPLGQHDRARALSRRAASTTRSPTTIRRA